jgi:hypothetical protein
MVGHAAGHLDAAITGNGPRAWSAHIGDVAAISLQKFAH